ncbi:hybrid cluster protein-associated redox disulfide domain-containing protein [Cohaesibacter marisflavi]|uniref:Hybrid cluster protein-associated redox disulfide domain-containing protein n=1 Tax=Cohaesibacter marisflavi TaxID=655353 RepID=A0A1I5NDU9_9HYPH|nr:DUF1858 domain-containing protein [Cohaesibacter marisflavi]SFP19944.1 hybrid cluster protein-associated redox disulfide domain-containing protein [Cohaesibacter marisflavi]
MTRKHLDSPDLTLDEVMKIWPQTITVFLRHKMLCVGCLVNPFHTIEDACIEYKLNEESFRAELQHVINAAD